MNKAIDANISAQETIRRIKAANQAATVRESGSAYRAAAEPALENKARASKHARPLAAESRKAAMNGVMRQLIAGELSQGAALKSLRISVLGMKQDAYAQLVGVARKTLSEIENDKGNYTSDVLNKVFKPFGLKVGLLPVSPHLLRELLAGE